MRSLPPSPRRSRSSFLPGESLVERLAATVARVHVVPIADVVLAELPAEIDLAPVDQRREVDETTVDVAQHDPGPFDGLQQPPHLEEGDPDLSTLVTAPISWISIGESLVGL